MLEVLNLSYNVISFIFFDMSDFENKIFNKIKNHSIYVRYINDILILTNDTNEINILQDTFQNIQFLILRMN